MSFMQIKSNDTRQFRTERPATVLQNAFAKVFEIDQADTVKNEHRQDLPIAAAIIRVYAERMRPCMIRQRPENRAINVTIATLAEINF